MNIYHILKPIYKGMRSVYEKLREKKHRYDIVNGNHTVLSVDKKQVADHRGEGFSFIDSYCYDLNSNDYHDYISSWEESQPGKKFNQYGALSGDKYLFAQVFGQYVKVPVTWALIEDGKLIWIEQSALSEENIYSFFIKMGGGVIKDRFGANGFNVYVFTVDQKKLYYKNMPVSQSELQEIIREFTHGIVQERIVQGEFENSIFDKSINTVRVLSVKKKDGESHEVIGALQRMGSMKSAPMDNFRQGGLVAPIDIATGRLGKVAGMFFVDEKGNHLHAERHPDTGHTIEGKIVPRWEEIVDCVSEITRRLPYFDLIAWDFVIRDDSCMLVEINRKSGLDVFQIHGGIRHSLIGEKYREYGYLVEKWDQNVR